MESTPPVTVTVADAPPSPPAEDTDNNKSSGTLSTRQYLDRIVVPVLLKAMTQLAKDRPPNPVEHLAGLLLQYKDEGEKLEKDSS